MKLKSIRVTKFRCVENSSEFTVCPVTCLVGKNGAGKTSLLEALYKLNPDVDELADFDVLMEYPRARRREYQRRAASQPDDVLTTKWDLNPSETEQLEHVLGSGSLPSKTVIIRKGYYRGRRWVIDRSNSGEHTPGDPNSHTITGQSASAGEDTTAPQDPPQKVGPRDTSELLETHLAGRLPKFLYFSKWHLMEGRVSLDALLQRKLKGELSGPDRVLLALLELGGTTIEDLSRIERSEELIADLEEAAKPITDEIARYWSQEKDLRVSFHLHPGKAQDPSPFDHGLVFETRIVNTKSNLSLNIDERSTGFVWFFSFLVWYSQVRRRFGDNLVVLLDDPGLGLHAKAQWDLLRYVSDRLEPNHQVLYATHSPFMIDPEKLAWVRTVEEVVEQDSHGIDLYKGTKVGDEILSSDHDTLLPLKASLGYRILRGLSHHRRILLVEKPEDALYLRWFSARLTEKGRVGLDSTWGIVPCGDLIRLATLVGLLSGGETNFAVLLSLSPEHRDLVQHEELMRLLQNCHTVALHKFAGPAESTVEDLLGPQLYFALVDHACRLSHKHRLSHTTQSPADLPVLDAVNAHFLARSQVLAQVRQLKVFSFFFEKSIVDSNQSEATR